MDQASLAIPSGEPPRPRVPVPPTSIWPVSVQMGLGFLVTAGLFFFLGRWSNDAASAPPRLVAIWDTPRPERLRARSMPPSKWESKPRTLHPQPLMGRYTRRAR